MTRIATTILLALVISMAGTACTGTSPEALRKEAQSNADKYLEFMRAGDFEGAYAKTLHADYKRQLALETFLKYREAIASTAGAIESYQVVHYDSDVERESVTLDYAVKYSRMPEPGTEIVKLRREGTEWRITSIEPKIPKKAAPAPDVTMPGQATKPRDPKSDPTAAGTNAPK